MSATKAPKKPKSADKKGAGSSKAKAAKAGKSSAKSGAANARTKTGTSASGRASWTAWC
jgi:hypothetical protein